MTFVAVCSQADVPVGKARSFTVAGAQVAVVNTDEGVFAFLDECTHAAVRLSDGDIEDCSIECPAHGSRFDLRTGWPKDLPAVAPVPIYSVRLSDGRVLVDLGSTESTGIDNNGVDNASTDNNSTDNNSIQES